MTNDQLRAKVVELTTSLQALHEEVGDGAGQLHTRKALRALLEKATALEKELAPTAAVLTMKKGSK